MPALLFVFLQNQHLRFMNLELDNELNDIISFAREEAMRLGNYTVTCDHLILGILRHQDNTAFSTLRAMGINTSALKDLIDGKLKNPDPVPVEKKDQLHLSKQAENALKIMFLEARSVKQLRPDPKQLLLAILRCGEGFACNTMFKQANVNYLTAKSFILNNLAENLLKRPTAAGKDADSDEDSGEIPDFYPDEPRPGTKKASEKSEKTSLLDSFSYDLTAAAREGKLDPVLQRDKEIARLAQILGRRKKNNPILIGEPGVGKSAIVEGLAMQIANRKAFPNLLGKRILSLDIGSIVAGTKYRGQFEERMKSILRELSRDHQVILFIDEIHTLVGAGSAAGSLDAANMLKPGLARGDLQCIGATTLDEYREYIEKDGALECRFQKVMVEPTDFAQTIDILQHIKTRYEEHHNVVYSSKAIEACVRLSQRYIVDRCLLDKAIDTLDEAGSRVSISSTRVPEQVQRLEEEIDKLGKQKREAVYLSDFEQAALLRDQEREKMKQLETLMEEFKKSAKEQKPTVTEEDVAAVVSMMAQVPISKVSESESARILKMAQTLKSKLIGQDEAIDSIVRAISRNRAGLKDPGKPIGTFIFLGPTGVGKTQLAKLVAEYLFDSKENMIRIDMSEYMEKYAVSRLIGAPPGYIGYDEGGQLTERIRRKPYSVVLLDEIEKAHPDIFNLLLQVFDEGRLTDSNGRNIDFRNTVLIMTSNIGSREINEYKQGLGFATSTRENVIERNKGIIQKALGRTFTPEFLNRVDEQILFNPLDKAAIFKIIDIELVDLYARMEQAGFTLQIDRKAKDFIAEKGFDPKNGARPLKRSIQRYLEDPISEAIIMHQPESGTQFKVKLNEEKTGTVVEL